MASFAPNPLQHGNGLLWTDRLRLDPLETGDAPLLNRLRNDRRARLYLPQREPESRSQTLRLIERMHENEARGLGINRAIRHTRGHLIGCASIWNVDRSQRSGDLGYLLDPRYWNRGYMTEALLAFFPWARTNLDLRHYGATVHHANRYSIRLLVRLGFEPTGEADDDGCLRFSLPVN